jgi:transcriptional regulator with XRE-family HTH domain
MNASEEEAQSNKAASSVPLSVGREEIDVGLRLREVRKARRRTLRDVAEATEITEGFLSQVERGKSNASVAVLRRIAVTLGVSLGDLFQEDSGQGLRVLSVANWPALSFGILGRKYHLHAAPDRQFDLLICDFEPGGSTGEEPYSHGDSEELVLVLEGSASLEVGTEVVALECNDSTVYRSSVPHRLTADPQTGARVLFVETPPSF